MSRCDSLMVKTGHQEGFDYSGRKDFANLLAITLSVNRCVFLIGGVVWYVTICSQVVFEGVRGYSQKWILQRDLLGSVGSFCAVVYSGI